MATKVLEKCRISPNEKQGQFSLPIVFFDMLFYDNPASQALYFYKFPCSESHFVETIVPDLKNSLSLTLSHFLPLAGNIIHPLSSQGNENKPVVRYVTEDSVSLTVTESNQDLNHLTGNHARFSNLFYPLAPHFPPATYMELERSIKVPVLALQVTLFPGQGICVGLISHHAVVDANAASLFMLTWSLINKLLSSKKSPTLKAGLKLIGDNCLPFYDRKTIVDLNNNLNSIYWQLRIKMKSSPAKLPPSEIPVDKVRSTFALKRDEIQKLKNYVCVKRGKCIHPLSSFTVTCALYCVSAAKSAGPEGNDVADDETEYIGVLADCRRRLDPPLPANYFGNCVAPMVVELNHGKLKGPNGFVMAVEFIQEVIRERVNGDKGILHWAEDWPEYSKLKGKRQCWVVGSPKFDFYGVDYGWGRPNKFEPLFTDLGDCISLCMSRDYEGGLEIGLVKTKDKMEAFAAVFVKVLGDLIKMT